MLDGEYGLNLQKLGDIIGPFIGLTGHYSLTHTYTHFVALKKMLGFRSRAPYPQLELTSSPFDVKVNCLFCIAASGRTPPGLWKT